MKKIDLFRLLACFFILMVMSSGAIAEDATTLHTSKTVLVAGAETELIDINSATQDELMTIPGIGEAYSGKIIKNRPYKTKTQLKTGKVIPESVYEKIKDKIIARQPK